MRYFGNVELNNQGELVIANVERGSSLPSGSEPNGTLFFNTSDNEMYTKKDGVWVVIGSGDIVDQLGEFSDVTITGSPVIPVIGQILVYNSSNSAFYNQTTQYIYDYTSTGTTSHVINHNLNCTTVSVQVYDASSPPQRIIPDEIFLNSANQCTVDVNQDINLSVIITGVGTQ